MNSEDTSVEALRAQFENLLSQVAKKEGEAQTKMTQAESLKQELQQKIDEFTEEKKAFEESRSNLENERESFLTERKRIADIQASSGDILKLNVGGTSLSASRGVLTLVKGSTLEAMFSGRHPIKQLESGEYFIDRTANVFSLVLEYLRNGCRIARIEDNFLR